MWWYSTTNHACMHRCARQQPCAGQQLCAGQPDRPHIGRAYKALIWRRYASPFTATLHLQADITYCFHQHHREDIHRPSSTMADTRGKVDGGGGDHSSGEYSGVVEQAAVGMNGNAQDLALVITSGDSARARREELKKNRQEEKKKREKEKAKNV